MQDSARSGSDSWYTAEQTDSLLNKYKAKWGTCEFPRPRSSKYTISYAPTMWQFWASDPKKKPFKRKPMVLHADAPTQLAADDFLKRKAMADPLVQPGRFNMTGYMGESGMVADALARAHKQYSVLNSRAKSGPVSYQY